MRGERILSHPIQQFSWEAVRAFIAAGVEPGDRVAIWAPNIAEWIVAAIGLQNAGATLVTLSTRWKGAEAGYALRKSGAKLLCTLGDFLGMDYVAALADQDLPDLERIIVLRDSAEGATSWADFSRAGDTVSREQAIDCLEKVSPEDPSDLIFTSGTTGRPKGVMATHGQSIKTFDVWCEVVGLRPGDRYLIVNPFFHSMNASGKVTKFELRERAAARHRGVRAEASAGCPKAK